MAKDDGFAKGMIVGAMLAKATAPRPPGEFNQNHRAALVKGLRTPDPEIPGRIELAIKLQTLASTDLEWLEGGLPQSADTLGRDLFVTAVVTGVYTSAVVEDKPSVTMPSGWVRSANGIVAQDGDRIALGYVLAKRHGFAAQATRVGTWNLSDPTNSVVRDQSDWLTSIWPAVATSSWLTGPLAFVGIFGLPALMWWGYYSSRFANELSGRGIVIFLLMFPATLVAMAVGFALGAALGELGATGKVKRQKEERQRIAALLHDQFQTYLVRARRS